MKVNILAIGVHPDDVDWVTGSKAATDCFAASVSENCALLMKPGRVSGSSRLVVHTRNNVG